MEKTNNVGGGSNISQAVSEAAQYFESDDEKSSAGNILLFTDAEESEGEFGIKVPNNVNLAVIGIGTVQGGMIPVRFDDGGFKGYKSIKNQPVISKLDEAYIKSLGNGVKNFSYWIANSYSIPTDEILDFFRSAYKKGNSTGDMRIRPVLSYYVLIPAVLIYIIYVILGRFKSFYVVLLVLCLGVNSANSSQEKKELSPETIELMNKVKKGKAEHKEILKLGEKFLREERPGESEVVYREYLKNTDSEEAKFNYVTSLLRQNKFKEALPSLNELMKFSKNEDLK
jgi:Ca-activated chloride channel family protein